MITIELRPTEARRRDSYGIVLESVTAHDVVGHLVHNPHHRHVVQVWENREREDRPGVRQDPHGRPTTARYSYLLSAVPTVIAAVPYMQQEQGPMQQEQGPTLPLESEVELSVNGYVLGVFDILGRRMGDPILTRVSD